MRSPRWAGSRTWGSGVAIHVMHHHPGRAVASVVLRAGLPCLGGLIGVLWGEAQAAGASPHSSDSGSLTGFPVIVDALGGIAIGVLSAMLFDDVFLSFESSPGRETPGPAAPPPTKAAFSVAPYAGAAPGARGEAQAALGVTGRF